MEVMAQHEYEETQERLLERIELCTAQRDQAEQDRVGGQRLMGFEDDLHYAVQAYDEFMNLPEHAEHNALIESRS